MTDRIEGTTTTQSTTPTPEPTPAPVVGVFFWLMTVQTGQDARGAFKVHTSYGTYEMREGDTRFAAYEALRNSVMQLMGVTAVNVLHFTFEPNDPAGGAR